MGLDDGVRIRLAVGGFIQLNRIQGAGTTVKLYLKRSNASLIGRRVRQQRGTGTIR